MGIAVILSFFTTGKPLKAYTHNHTLKWNNEQD